MADQNADEHLTDDLKLDNEDTPKGQEENKIPIENTDDNLPPSNDDNKEGGEGDDKSASDKSGSDDSGDNTELNNNNNGGKSGKKNGFQKRLERERRKGEERANQIEASKNAEIDALKKKHGIADEAPTNDSSEPSPDDYHQGANDPQYIKDTATHAGAKAFRDEKAKSDKSDRQARANQTLQDANDNYVSKADEAAIKYDDFDDVLESSEVMFNDPNVQYAIQASEQAGELAYYLAKNPKEAEKIANMESIQAIGALGRLEAKLENAEPSEKPDKDVSDMTPPLDIVDSGKNKSRKTYSDNMSDSDYQSAYPDLPNT